VSALEAFACGFHGEHPERQTHPMYMYNCIPESITTAFMHNYVQSVMYTAIISGMQAELLC